ncbi:MAG: tetratricopeptide repeat protein [Candidatus Omnitrophica bacterium]|nr:tetratricopeptide repeat protein [Candidatus Omnitrophota bacterium]
MVFSEEGTVQFTQSCKKYLKRLLPANQNQRLTTETRDVKFTFLVKRAVKEKLETGRALLEKGRLNEAIEAYFAAVELDPKCGISQFNLAYAYHEDGQYDMAREHYLKAIEREPTCPYFLENLGRLNFETLDYPEAARLFQRASMIGSIQPLSLGLWGRALFEQALYEESIEAFQQLIQREKQDVIHIGALYWQIISNIKLERMAAARTLALKLLSKKKVDYKVLYDLGEHFIEVKCLDLAKTIFEKISIEKEEFLLSRLRLEDIRKLEKEINDMLPGLFEGDEDQLLYQIHSLQAVGNLRVSKAMLSLIENPSPLVRENILKYHTKYGYDASDSLLPLLSDEVHFVRDAAYDYFVKLDNPNMLNLISEGMKDPLVEIRKKAFLFAGRYASIEMAPSLELAAGCAANREIADIIRQSISSIKRRYQENLDYLFKKSPSYMPLKEKYQKKIYWKFWFMIALQGALVFYFLYVLFTRF